MKKRVFAVALIAIAAVANSAAAETYYDLGPHERAVTAANADAAEWFRRGLLQAYGFNHEEAVRCFEHALAADPDMAMAYWGIAYALGPNYNNPVMEPDASQRAYESVQAALARAGNASEVERALIDAVAARYSMPPPEDRSELEAAYAQAMHSAYDKHPDDSDVAAIYVEALMQLRPWQLWTKDGRPTPGTSELVSAIESALERWPDHPALCHFYIHAVEPSPDPGRALPAANRLRGAVPDAGHLVHMPTHIDVLVGDYDKVVATNQRAIAVDEKFVAREGKMNFYTLYRVHNWHFLVYGAMFDGRNQLAIEAAEQLASEIPAELLAAMPDYLEAFMPTVLHVRVRFGQWGEILATAEPPADQPYTRAIWRYARTISYASLDRVDEAGKEFALLKAAMDEVPETRILFNNTCADIMNIAVLMAEGELEYRRGNFDNAFRLLRAAIEFDDNLNYDEPWSWMQPARHALGALLLERGRVADAEAVYRADLKRHPNNGWALHGLSEALRRQGQKVEAASCESQLEGAWARSDIELQASCFCRTGTMAKDGD